jgi:PAS domain S-box-containing protein
MRKNKALRITIIFATVGVLITLLIAYVERNILSTYQRNLPYITLGDNIKNRSTQAHLWFEELMAGDPSLNFERDVLPLFVASQKILQGAYDGEETELGKFEKVSDEDLLALLKESVIDIEKLTDLARQRWESHQQNASLGDFGVGSEMDQEFDVAYEAFQVKLDGLVQHVNATVRSDSGYLNVLSWVSLILFFVAFTILCTMLYRLQHSSDKMVTENTQRMEQQGKAVTSLSDFIEAISAGDYNRDLQLEGDEGNLSSSLIKMRDKLKENAQEDRRRNWSTAGLAQIGEILRSSSTNTKDLYDSILQFVVKYTNSNQGGLFILNDDEEGKEYLELVASYAFERKKYLEKKIDLGQGLIGQCYQEGERIYLIEVPHDYVNITSGLGGTNPNCLLLVPMKVNEKIYGVIELASFEKYKDYQIELIEKLAESIASTISSVRVNDTTRVLLERTQQQAEEMKSQEEEIRQNMEELEATQEEMRRKQTILEKELDQSQKQAEMLTQQEKVLKDSQDTLQAIVDNIPRAIFWKDKELRFQGCNKIFSDVAGLNSPRDIVGHTDFDMPWSAQAEEYRKDDMEVMKSRKAKLDIEEVNINSEGEESWVRTSKVPIVNQHGEVVAVLGMFEDITAHKRQEADIKQKLREREQALKELEELKKTLALR